MSITQRAPHSSTWVMVGMAATILSEVCVCWIRSQLNSFSNVHCLKVLVCTVSIPLVAGDGSSVQWDVEIDPTVKERFGRGWRLNNRPYLMRTRLSLTFTASTLSLLNAIASNGNRVRERERSRGKRGVQRGQRPRITLRAARTPAHAHFNKFRASLAPIFLQIIKTPMKNRKCGYNLFVLPLHTHHVTQLLVLIVVELS